jgi:hypothetical protein
MFPIGNVDHSNTAPPDGPALVTLSLLPLHKQVSLLAVLNYLAANRTPASTRMPWPPNAFLLPLRRVFEHYVQAPRILIHVCSLHR